MKKHRFADITIEITNQCNLKCKFCNIWKEKSSFLSFEEIKNVLIYLSNSYGIASVSITGGEPFLHPELEKIIRFLILLKLNNKIKSFGIYSNGYTTNTIKRILEKLKKYLPGITIGISLDGLKKTHNFLRGKKDAFSSTSKTIEYINNNLKDLITLELKFTINNQNYSNIYEIYKYCKEKNIIFSPKFIESNVKNYYHRKQIVQHFDFMEKKEIKASIEKQLQQIIKEEKKLKSKHVSNKIIYMLLGIIKFRKDFIQTCLTPSRSLFITCQGKIYPCLYLNSIGDIKKIENAIFNTQHQKIIKKGLTGKCPKCFAYHGFLKGFNFNPKNKRN